MGEAAAVALNSYASSWVAFLEGLAQAGVDLEDLINDSIQDAKTADDVREEIADMLDDEEAQRLFADFMKLITEDAVQEVVSNPAATTALSLGTAELDEKRRRCFRLARTRLALLQRVLQVHAQTPQDKVPAILAELPPHPRVVEVGLKLNMATFAGLGLVSHNRRPLTDLVLDTLLDICIEGEQGHYAYIVPVARALGIDVEPDEELLPEGVMDLDELARQYKSFDANRQRLLNEARKSGLPVYPPPTDG